MNELEQLLTDNQLKKDFKLVLERAIKDNEVNQCFWAVKNIESGLPKISPEAKAVFDKEFRPLYLNVKWLAVPRLVINEVLVLLEKNLLAVRGFDQEVFNLTEVIRACLLGMIDYDERDDFKIKARQALLANREVIDSQANVKEIGSWLRDIISQVGLELNDRLKEEEYYLRNENYRQLKNIDQSFLKQIISLYKYCLFSSQTPEGLDEAVDIVEDGKIKVIERGQIITLPPLSPADERVIEEFIKDTATNTTSVLPAESWNKLKKLQDYYHQTLNKSIDKGRLQSLSGATRQPTVILSELNNSLALKDITAVLDNLQSLIMADAWEKLLKDNFQNKALAAYLKARLNSTDNELISKFNPEVFSLYLQSVFMGKLNLNLEESAVLALYLANQMAKKGQKEYLSMVYGDTQSSIFKWREIEIKENKLSFK